MEIFSREIPDLLRAGAVCSSWHQTPCLFYTCESAGKNVGCIYSLAEQRTYKLTLPDPPIHDRHLIGSSDGGLLVTLDDMSEMHLLNPVTGEQMALPSVGHLTIYQTGPAESLTAGPDGISYAILSITMKQVNPIYDESGAVVWYEHLWHYWADEFLIQMPMVNAPSDLLLYFHAKAFVFTEALTGSLLVVLIHHPVGQLSFARVGDDEWTSLPPQYRDYQDCTYKDGLLYAVTALGEIHAIDLSGNSAMVKVVMGKVLDIRDDFRNTYILHAPWGDVLQIWKTEEEEYVHPSEDDDYDAILKNTANIEVYKCDLVEGKLVKINPLQDHVLFVGHNQTFCLSAEEFPSLKANHAYFTDDSQNWITQFKNNRRDIGLFNLDDNSRDELVCPQLWSNWPVPVWITVNLAKLNLACDISS
uniref:KIB1-4 beta-propeller domain-containing protein n=1 Tax=Leersia perrieri TaxID=77586 RepID=A0A0D9W095_9ORYZ